MKIPLETGEMASKTTYTKTNYASETDKHNHDV
jgi:hypothetical protein